MVRGPEGLYTFQIVAKNDEEIESETLDIYIKSNVAEISPLNMIPVTPDYLKLNVAISPQPEVKIVDFEGKPVVGKIAIAFSYIEPLYGSTEGVTHMMSARKYFTMAGVLSQPSNDEGVAKFTDLTVTGSTGASAYILISVDGLATTWTTIYNPVGLDMELPPRGIIPLIVEQDVMSITIVTDFPATATEGVHLSQIPEILVKDRFNNPLSGVQCYTEIYSVAGAQYPLGYAKKEGGQVAKKLMYSQAGIYSSNSINPFA